MTMVFRKENTKNPLQFNKLFRSICKEPVNYMYYKERTTLRLDLAQWDVQEFSSWTVLKISFTGRYRKSKLHSKYI